jgi:hypothetical protein
MGGERRSAALKERPAALKSASLEGKEMVWSMEQREYFEFGSRKNRRWEGEQVGAAFSRGI